MNVFVEGKPDLVLVMALGVPRKSATKAGNKGNVCNALEKFSNATGLIDEDPGAGQPSYLIDLQELEEKHRLRFLSDRKRENLIIVFCPNLEDWLVWASAQSKIAQEFNLPKTGNELHRVVNARLFWFEKLLKNLLEVENEPLCFLKKVLEGEVTVLR